MDASTKGADTPDSANTAQKSTDAAQQAAKDPKAAQQQRQIDTLAKIDRNVHAHEQAHLAAASGLAMGGATFTYQRGPDGKQYAVAGEVQIDVSPGKTPQETLTKAERIKAAALAPADPSAQDRAVASRATQMASEAQAEIIQEKLDKSASNDSGEPSGHTQAGASASAARRGIASYRATGNGASQAAGNLFNIAA